MIERKEERQREGGEIVEREGRERESSCRLRIWCRCLPVEPAVSNTPVLLVPRP